MEITGLSPEPFEFQLDFENLKTEDLAVRQEDNTFSVRPGWDRRGTASAHR